MSEGELDPETILNAFGDELAREILVLANRDAVSIDDLDEHLDASRPTIYRRASELVDADLLAVRRRVNPSGRDFREFKTTVKELEVVVEDDRLTLDVSVQSQITGRFEAFWQGLERSIQPIQPEVVPDDLDHRQHHPSE